MALDCSDQNVTIFCLLILFIPQGCKRDVNLRMALKSG
jgi:hypothetical protein